MNRELKIWFTVMAVVSFAYTGHNNLGRVHGEAYFCKDTTPWDIFLEPSLALKNIDYSRCELCNFTVRNEINDSTNEDLIITAAVGHIANENFFARTIRTAKSKCRIVIVCDKNAINGLPKERYKAAVACGVQFCVVPKRNWNTGYWGQASIAYYYVLAFLLRNRGRFKRIIFQDLFDSVFQGDPFTTDLTSHPNEVHVTTEYQLGNNSFMNIFYKEANIIEPEWYMKKYFKNSSHFGGSAETILNFMLVFVSVNDFGHSWNDQITANYMYFSGAMEKYGITYNDDTKLERFVNLISGKPVEKTNIGNYHALFSSETYAVSIHQTWVNADVMLNIAQICSIKERDENKVRDYFGKCNDDCIKKIMEYYKKIDAQSV